MLIKRCRKPRPLSSAKLENALVDVLVLMAVPTICDDHGGSSIKTVISRLAEHEFLIYIGSLRHENLPLEWMSYFVVVPVDTPPD